MFSIHVCDISDTRMSGNDDPCSTPVWVVDICEDYAIGMLMLVA